MGREDTFIEANGLILETRFRGYRKRQKESPSSGSAVKRRAHRKIPNHPLRSPGGSVPSVGQNIPA